MPNEKPYILLDNRLDDGVPTATTTASGYDVLNLRDWRPYTYWKANTNAVHYLTVDCGSAKTADSLAILSHDLFTQGAQVSVECSSDNFSADTTVALAAFGPTDNKAVFKTFAAQTKRYWRLKIANLTAACFLGILAIGTRITFPRYLLESFDPIAEEPKGESARNPNGQILGSVVGYIEKTARVRFQSLTTTFAESTFRPAWDLHISKFKPFFWMPDYTNRPQDAFLMAIKPGARLEMPWEGLSRRLELELIGVKE